MQIRRLARNDDFALAGGLVRDAYLGIHEDATESDYETMVADVGARFDDVVVAVDPDGTIVGCLTFIPDMDHDHAEFDDPGGCSFRYFGVDPAHQGRGIGELMVRWVIAEAGRLGRQRVRIHTLESMTAAQRLYAKLGFVRAAEFDEVWDGIIGLAFVAHLDV